MSQSQTLGSAPPGAGKADTVYSHAKKNSLAGSGRSSSLLNRGIFGQSLFPPAGKDILNEMSHQTQENDPALIALTTMLDRAINPKDSLTLEIKPHGIFGLPEDLIKSHETNNYYLWRAKMFGKCIDLGKFLPRELTEEEIEAQKNKKKPDS